MSLASRVLPWKSSFGVDGRWVLLAALCGCVSKIQLEPAAPAGTPEAAAESVARLTRGMNLGNALEAPQEGAWGVTLSVSHFKSYAEAGFDHVRLPVRFSAHAGNVPPYVLDETFMRRVDWAIAQARANHLTVIVDLHNYDELHARPAEHADRFVALWRQIATRYRNQPRTVVLELLNEPHDGLSSAAYNPIAARALAEIRAIDPTRLVITDSVSWAKASTLAELDLPAADANLMASFHMYEPHLFTHQGMSWMPPEWGTTGVMFPGPPSTPINPTSAAKSVGWVSKWFADYNSLPADQNPSGPKTIREQFDFAVQYTEHTHLPVYMGEFGAADSADPTSRVRWVRAVREEADKRHIGWAYWDDGGRFKAFDVGSHSWLQGLGDALLK